MAWRLNKSGEPAGTAMVSGTGGGPLGLAVSADTLASTLTDRLNEQLAAQGKQAQEVRVEQGRVVIIIA